MKTVKNFFIVTAVLSLVMSAVSASASAQTKVITLEQAIGIALDENASVRIADMDIEKTGYARKGSYAALYPQIDGSASYQRTIKKQVMYMDFDMGTDYGSDYSSSDGFEVGRWNAFSAGVSASLPLVNAQLWESLKISDSDVELAVEKARGSRLSMVTQVKNAYYAVLLAKQAFDVYKSVYENALENLEQTRRKYNAQRASELDLTRAKTSYANAIPNVYDAENSVVLALWRLKAVMGVDLQEDIDVAGSLDDYAAEMAAGVSPDGEYDLTRNSTMRQLAIQAEELANTVKLQKYANIPTLALAFNYSIIANTNDFVFSEYKWSPYSYVGLSLNIPIFAGGKRSNAVKQARVQADELALTQADTERQLRISIRQYLGTMDTQMRSLDSAKSAVESAQKAYDIARKSYNVGRSTLTDLNDSQLALVQAQLSVSQAIYSFEVAKASLEEILGNE